MAQKTAKKNEKSLSMFYTPNLSIVDKNYADDVDDGINLIGFSLKYSSRELDDRFYLSYGIDIQENSISQKSIRVHSNNEYTYEYKLSYTYIAPSIELNYLLVNTEVNRLGISTGLFFKYFLRKKLKHHLSDGWQSASLSLSDITDNYSYNNPGLMTSIWYQKKLNESMFLHSGVNYTYDLNYTSSVPMFQKIGISLGLVINLGN
jgi:hypothetical protein